MTRIQRIVADQSITFVVLMRAAPVRCERLSDPAYPPNPRYPRPVPFMKSVYDLPRTLIFVELLLSIVVDRVIALGRLDVLG